ncbi:hypothetical protein ABZV77_01385 [Streptomyces sp. NPDC004732]|uniref:hypothetical protein n=1 Tax=Streptomyces sp. NPDC004732 TaxID=3154290 RepID=UPI0033B76BF3
MNPIRRICAIGAAAAAGAVAIVALFPPTGSGDAVAQPRVDGSKVVAAADSQPGYAVEDFNYPDADRILKDKGIVLKRGDGHITLAECGSASGLMEVYSRRNDSICFRTTGTSGYLTMEIPAVYGVKTSAMDADLKLSAEGKQSTVAVDKNTFKPVGETVDPGGREHVLLEIRTSK